MQYINPYQLLNICADEFSEIDIKSIGRDRRNLLHQIELSESGSIDFNGIDVTRAQCIRVLDELDDKNKREFHFFIFKNESLNNFLTLGVLDYFEKHSVESIYKFPAFISFISQYFDPRYDEALAKNFKLGNKGNVRKILSVQPLTSSPLNENCYKTTYHYLNDADKKINQIINDINSGKSEYIQNSFGSIENEVKSIVNIELLNLLPTYFQGIRNTIAMSVRNLAKDINNDPHNLVEPAFKVSSIAIQIESDGITRQIVSRGYNIIKGRYEYFIEQIKKDKYEPQIRKFYILIDEIDSQNKLVAKKITSANLVCDWINANIDITELNNCSSAAAQARNSVALSINRLSISIWNNLDEIDIALIILSKATLLKVSEETKAILIDTKIQLEELKSKIQKQRLVKATKNENTNSRFGILIVIGIIILVIYFISSYNNSHSNETLTSSNDSPKFYTPKNINIDTVSSNIDVSPHSIGNNQSDLPYQKVVVLNGNFPDCSSVLPKYDKGINTRLIITAENTDVAVKVYNFENDRCIRYVFVNNGSTYTIKNIPEGRYYLKIAYGNDWEVQEGEPLCKGRFATHSSFKKDQSVYDFTKTYYDDGSISVPYYTLKLYRAYDSYNYQDNSAFNSISESEFNNN